MKEENRFTSYKEISGELGRMLVKLYGEKIFPRQGKVFADMLFQTGVEAGAFVAALQDVEERSAKIEMATNALIKINEAAYLLDIMKKGAFYSAENVQELEEYLDVLRTTMRELLNIAYAQLRREAVSHPVKVARSAPAPAPAQMKRPAPAPAPKPVQTKPKPQPQNDYPYDPDGFNAPADE